MSCPVLPCHTTTRSPARSGCDGSTATYTLLLSWLVFNDTGVPRKDPWRWYGLMVSPEREDQLLSVDPWRATAASFRVMITESWRSSRATTTAAIAGGSILKAARVGLPCDARFHQPGRCLGHGREAGGTMCVLRARDRYARCTGSVPPELTYVQNIAKPQREIESALRGPELHIHNDEGFCHRKQHHQATPCRSRRLYFRHCSSLPKPSYRRPLSRPRLSCLKRFDPAKRISDVWGLLH
jgi:hypothetical protein